MRRKGSPRLGLTWQLSTSKALLFLTYLNKGKEVSCHCAGLCARGQVYYSTNSFLKYSCRFYFQGKYKSWQFGYCSCILKSEISLACQIICITRKHLFHKSVLGFDIFETWQALNITSSSTGDGVVSRLLLHAEKCQSYYDRVIDF